MNRNDFDSVNLYSEWILIEKEISERMFEGIRWMNEKKIEAIIIGAVAVANYLTISRTLTPDVDFLANDINGVKKKLKANFISYKPLYNEMGIFIERFNMDVLNADYNNRKFNLYALKNYNVVKIGGIRVKMITPELLAIMKFSSGREKDDADAFTLLKSGAVDKKKFLQKIKTLKKHLNNSVELIRYSEIIPKQQ